MTRFEHGKRRTIAWRPPSIGGEIGGFDRPVGAGVVPPCLLLEQTMVAPIVRRGSQIASMCSAFSGKKVSAPHVEIHLLKTKRLSSNRVGFPCRNAHTP